MSIPRLVHHVWLGGNAPESNFASMEGWTVNVLDEETIQECWGIPTDGHPNFVSNLVRFLAVRDFGGMYADLDLAPLDDFEDLIEQDFFAFKIHSSRNSVAMPNLVSNQLFGSVKNGRIVRIFCDLIHPALEPPRHHKISETNGTMKFTSFLDEVETLEGEVIISGGLARNNGPAAFRAVETSGSRRISRA